MSIIYIPTVATLEKDINISYALAKQCEQKGFELGLMLVINNGLKGIEGENRIKQHHNFQKLTSQYGKISTIVMASNNIYDLDFYHYPQKSIDHIKKCIDFAKDLPGAKDITVTFHLNTLFRPDEWKEVGSTYDEKENFFTEQFKDVVFPAIKNVADYAKSLGVKLLVETTPVPEFGDVDDERNKLGNPYPLYAGRGFQELRDAGLGIVLDFCHTYTLYKAVHEKLSSMTKEDFFDTYKGIFPTDIEKLKYEALSLELDSLQSSDIVHLTDSKELFDPENHVFHQEGLALGDGEIKNMKTLIIAALRKNIRLVFEQHETDFENRPNTKKSMEYLFALSGGRL